jgi:penicillin-binding protein 1C
MFFRFFYSIAIFLCFLIGCRLFLPKPPLMQGITFSQSIYDEQHHLLRLTLSSDDKYRVYTPLDEISPLLVRTTLLQEDQFFFLHPGFNPVAIVKAAWQTYVLRSRAFGASTITMQVARMRYGIHSRSIKGKLRQILKAVQLELFYSKKQILEAYLNLASYGGNVEGIGAASIIYFGKSANQLNLAEALRVSVVPQNPARRMPTLLQQQDLQNAYGKLFQRWLTRHPEDKALESLIHLPIQLTKKNLPFHAPHFVESILRKDHQLKVVSTLNLKLQELIEKITRQYLAQRQLYGINNAALMLVDTRDMGVKALIGSGNYFDASIAGQVNGTKVKRSPGSTLKPFIYALAIDQGLIHPCTVLKDTPSNFNGYHPENFDKNFLGPIQAKEA